MIAGSLLAAPVAAEAQQAAKVARIGWLGAHPTRLPPEAFLQGLRDLGYVEGRNLVIEYRDADGKPERLPALVAELVALRVDVIVAPPTVAALTAKQATRTLPIVFIGAADPVTSGLVTSFSAGRQCHGAVQPRPGASRQGSGTAQAGRSGGQPRSLSSGSQMASANARTRPAEGS